MASVGKNKPLNGKEQEDMYEGLDKVVSIFLGLGFCVGTVVAFAFTAVNMTSDARVKNSKPIEISGSVYVCQKANVVVK